MSEREGGTEEKEGEEGVKLKEEKEGDAGRDGEGGRERRRDRELLIKVV